MKKQSKDVSLILVDIPSKFKELLFDEWYKSSFSEKDGIYVGTGAGDQGAIKINNYNKELSLEYKNNYGFQINEGMYKVVKLIEFEKAVEEDPDE